MKKLNLKQQMILVIFIIALFGIGVSVLIILPTYKNIRELQTIIDGTQTYLEEQYEKTQRMKKSVHSLDVVAKQIAIYEKAIVRQGDELKIITQLEDLAVSANVKQILKVNLADGREKTLTEKEDKLPPLLRDKSSFVFSFVSEGEYENLIKYIKTIETLPYYFNTDSMHFSKNKDNNLVTLRFSGQIYIF